MRKTMELNNLNTKMLHRRCNNTNTWFDICVKCQTSYGSFTMATTVSV